MKNNLLVTLADKNYIDQAKQLFSSVYFNAGWQGDYMLLAHEIPDKDLQWFLNKGILVKKCKPLFDKNIGIKNNPPVLLDKFYLLTPEFKKWKNIVFLDADIIARKSLEGLNQIDGFVATSAEILRDQFNFEPGSEIEKSLSKKYDFSKMAFNTGVMAFNTDIIKDGSFEELLKLFHEYYKIQNNNEETALNIFFYEKWKAIPFIYNFNPFHIISDLASKKEVCNLPAIILHFYEIKKPDKPWFKQSIFYPEWKNNLDRADNIDLEKRITVKIVTNEEIQKYCIYIKKRLAIYKYLAKLHGVSIFARKIDRLIGQFGIYLKNKYPTIYKFIKHGKV